MDRTIGWPRLVVQGRFGPEETRGHWVPILSQNSWTQAYCDMVGQDVASVVKPLLAATERRPDK